MSKSIFLKSRPTEAKKRTCPGKPGRMVWLCNSTDDCRAAVLNLLRLADNLGGAAPECLRDCCIGTHSSASGLRLRSLEKIDLRVRRMRTHFGDRAFSAAGPRCWNSLPPAIRLTDSVDSFKVQLKTYLFARAYPV